MNIVLVLAAVRQSKHLKVLTKVATMVSLRATSRHRVSTLGVLGSSRKRISGMKKRPVYWLLAARLETLWLSFTLWFLFSDLCFLLGERVFWVYAWLGTFSSRISQSCKQTRLSWRSWECSQSTVSDRNWPNIVHSAIKYTRLFLKNRKLKSLADLSDEIINSFGLVFFPLTGCIGQIIPASFHFHETIYSNIACIHIHDNLCSRSA